MTRVARALVCALACAGCVTYERGVIDLAAPQPPPIPMETIAEHVDGRSCGSFVERQYEEAVEDALRKAPGADALVKVSYRFENLCIVVHGRAVRIARDVP